MAATYFYCFSLTLGVGSIVLPGNWGRMFLHYTPQKSPNPWTITREYIYELVRLQSFPDKPSRLKASFLCFTEQDMHEFRAQNDRPQDVGYEVELLNPDAPSHIGDWNIPTMTPNDNLVVFHSKAQMYWEGVSPIKPELVTMSPFRIVRVIG